MEAGFFKDLPREAVDDGRVGSFDAAAGDLPLVGEAGFLCGAAEQEEPWYRCAGSGGGEGRGGKYKCPNSERSEVRAGRQIGRRWDGVWCEGWGDV